MKILAFTDIHGSSIAFKRIESMVRVHKPDLMVCTGDISIFEHGILGILKRLNRIEKEIIIIHGNHENQKTFLKYSRSLNNLTYIHNKPLIIGDLLFLGYGGGGFSITDKNFERISRNIFEPAMKDNKGKKAILLTHAPPYKTRLDKIVYGHCGNKSIRNFIEKNKIALHFCGHIHENFGKEDKIKKTRIINPGPFGKITIVN